MAIALIPGGAAAQDAAAQDMAAQNEMTLAGPEEDALLSDEQQTILPDNMSPDQVIQFFTVFSESAEMDAALAPLIEEVTAPGDRVEDWDQLGIDILAEAQAAEQKGESFMLRDLDEEVLTVTDLTGGEGFKRPDFTSYALRPDPVGLVNERAISSFFPGIWFEAGVQRRQQGNALCYAGYSGITLHTQRPHTDWSENELLTTATVFAVFDRMGSREFCLVYDRGSDGQYITRAFTPDGRSLPAFDAQLTPAVLMPRSDLAQFLTKVPAQQPPSAQPPSAQSPD